MSDFSAFDNALRSLESIPLARVAGRLVRLNGILLESVGCPLMTGQLCRIESANQDVVGFFFREDARPRHQADRLFKGH